MTVWYMSGAGNRFLIIDSRGLTPELPALARELCALKQADGFLALTEDPIADFRMNFYNSDGSRAAMCGNGARCICRFAYEVRIAGPSMVLQTDAGLLWGKRLRADLYRVRLNDPGPLYPGEVSRITCGVPHVVVELESLDFSMAESLRPRAGALREQWDANVDFFTETGFGKARVLSYERGVENFTAACGTGCGAVASVLRAQQRLDRRLEAENPGGALQIDFTPEGTWLTGPVEILEIFEYSL